MNGSFVKCPSRELFLSGRRLRRVIGYRGGGLLVDADPAHAGELPCRGRLTRHTIPPTVRQEIRITCEAVLWSQCTAGQTA